MAKKSQLTLALDFIDAEIAKLQGVREAILATKAAVTKLQKPKAPKPRPLTARDREELA